MIRPALISVAVLLLLASPPAAAADDATCIRAIDGDSLVVKIAGGDVLKIRLIGVDAPEHGQEWGQEAKAFAETWCDQGGLSLEYDKERTDRYHRTLAYAWRNGAMFNEQLVRAGLAIPVCYTPNCKYLKRLHMAETEAKTAKAGFWAQGGLKLTPAQFRKKQPPK